MQPFKDSFRSIDYYTIKELTMDATTPFTSSGRKTVFLNSGIFLLALIIANFSFGQRSAAEGMTSKERNFTSFSNKTKSSLDSWRKFNDEKYFDHPEFGFLPDNAPCSDCVEDLSKREKDLRYYVNINDPSRYYVQKAQGVLHHFENGFWKTMEHNLTKSSPSLFVSDFPLNQVRIDMVKKHTEIVTSEGAVALNNWKLFKRVNSEEVFLEEANWTEFTAGDDGIVVKNIFSGIDAQFIIYPGGIKTNFIIKEANYGNYDALIFRDALSLSTGKILKTDLKTNPSETEGVDNILVSSNGKELVEFKEALGYALDGNKDSYQALSYVLKDSNVDVVVSSEWIEKYITHYRLVVDPLVTGSNTLAQASIAGSQYNTYCNFVNSCNHNLTVPAPANATFDDVLWSFDYEAFNGCYREDGAVRFTTGTCISPSGAGMFWFCPLASPGLCTGTNVSVFSELGGCLPSPSCSPQNVNFTMQFFRCWGSTGCNNNCIRPFSPWTMTITGQTIEYTNATNPITLSSSTVCQGQSLTASTSGQNGVSPYTYNWSFSPSGSPSVGTGASASITFPTAGSVTLYSIVTDNCGNQTTASTNVTVHPTPTVTANPTSQTVCDGLSTNISLSGTPSGVTYSWTANPTNVTGSSNGTGNLINQTLSSASGGNVVYTITPSANGCSGSSENVTVNVVTNPTPTITGATTYCAGSTASISTTSTYSTYSWSNGANTQNTNVTNADNPITVTVTDGNGCTGTSSGYTVTEQAQINYSETVEICQGQSAVIHGNSETTAGVYQQTFTTSTCDSVASITLVVNSLPTISASASVNPICVNNSTVLSASGGSTYTWDNGLGSGAGHSVSPSTTTTYTVTGTDANSCQNTDQVQVVVNPLPTVNAPADITECENATITLSGSGSATNYSWDNGVTDGVGFTQPIGTVTYTVTGTDANGCQNTDQVDVTIQAAPTVNAGPDIEVCENETITLQGTGNAANYTWDNGVMDGVGFTQPPGTITYTVTGTLSGSCSATDEVDVTVNSAPIVNAGSDATLCEGDDITLTATGNANSYTWDNGVTDGVSFTPGVGTTIYTVTGENTTTGCENTDQVEITVNPLPNIEAGADQVICEGEEVTLSGSGGAVSYIWDNGVQDGVSFIPPSGTIVYTVTGTDANGCIGTDNVSVTVNTTPDAEFTANPTSGEAPLEVNFINNSTNGTSFEWDFGNGITDITNLPDNQDMIYTLPGEYEVWLTATNNSCSDQMSMIIVVTDLPLSYVVPNVFTPNGDGSNDKLHMSVNNAESVYMEIFNRWGNLVGIVDSMDPEDGWDGTNRNSGKPVSEGVYFYTYKITSLTGEVTEGHHFVHIKGKQ